MQDNDPSWSAEHDGALAALVARHGADWARIAAGLRARFGSVRQRAQMPPPPPPPDVVVADVVDPMLVRSGNPWTPNEEAELVALVGQHGRHWTRVARLMRERFGAARAYNLNSIKRKWKYMTGSAATRRMRAANRAPLWTEPEERLLDELVARHGHRWTQIAAQMAARFGYLRRYSDKKVQAKWRARQAKAAAAAAAAAFRTPPPPIDGPRGASGADPFPIDLLAGLI